MKFNQRKHKRKNSGLILRLVDVVFILLFGFISISEVDKKSKVQLPKSEQVPVNVPAREQVVFIGVLPGGIYLVDEETVEIHDDVTLQKYINDSNKQLSNGGIDLKVRVKANYNSSVKYAFRVIQICQDQQIPVGMDVIKTKG